MGHNLGMWHDFIDMRPVYTDCRLESNGSRIACSECANYQSGNWGQPIGTLTGHPKDCCNGIMGYRNHPHYWSSCSNRNFAQHYVSKNWENCMDATIGRTVIKITFLRFELKTFFNISKLSSCNYYDLFALHSNYSPKYNFCTPSNDIYSPSNNYYF